MKTKTLAKPDRVDSGYAGRYMTLIYNNDINTFDEVIVTLMIATGCCYEEAYTETWEAHTYGKAPVHFGSEEECLTVAACIAQIGVKTEVCKEWQ